MDLSLFDKDLFGLESRYDHEVLVEMDEKVATQALRLLEALDDHDDVQKVYANFDISDEVMQKVAGEG